MKSLLSLAEEYGSRGISLKTMSSEIDVNYSVLKEYLSALNYKHPIGLALIENRIFHESGYTLKDLLIVYIDEDKSRNEAAKELAIDNRTIQKASDIYGLTWLRKKPAPKHFENIIAATRKRQAKRNDLR